MKIKQLTIAFCTFILSACANQPNQVIISPELVSPKAAIYQTQQANLTVTDMRAGNHIVQVLRIDEAAKLFSSRQPLDSIINTAVSKHLNAQGLELTLSEGTKIEIIIDNALISVQQEMMKYKVNSEIVLRFVIQSGDKTLTNTFRNRGNSNGALTADVAVLERDFNQQLSALLTQALSNADVQQFIRQ